MHLRFAGAAAAGAAASEPSSAILQNARAVWLQTHVQPERCNAYNGSLFYTMYKS